MPSSEPAWHENWLFRSAVGKGKGKEGKGGGPPPAAGYLYRGDKPRVSEDGRPGSVGPEGWSGFSIMTWAAGLQVTGHPRVGPEEMEFHSSIFLILNPSRSAWRFSHVSSHFAPRCQTTAASFDII